MIQDLRYSLRELRKRPGLALTAIISLTLGIGATAAMFSVVYGLLANTYPYKDADRMIHLVVKDDRNQDQFINLTGAELSRVREASCFESVAATWGGWNLTTTGEDFLEDVPSTQLTGNAGIHFGVPALLGRTILPSDAPEGKEPEPVVVLSYLFWQRHYNADPGVIGRNLQLVHKNYAIIGVLPSRFTWDDADVYLPLKVVNDPKIRYTGLFRLKPGITHQAVNAELQPMIEQFAKEFPDQFPKKLKVAVQGFNDAFLNRIGPSLYLLFGAVALLLLVGCANVSILLLARGTARQHELAIRSAIGASRWRIQRQLLVESVTLSVLGGLGGIAFAYGLLPLVVRWLPEFAIPHEAVIRINIPVLVFSIVIGMLTGIVSGLAPALQFSRPEIAQLIQSTSRRAAGGSKLTYQILVAGQIALTVLLLTSAGASINGFLRLIQTNLGYDPHNTMSVGIPVHEKSHGTWEDRSHYFGELLSRIQALPEVEVAGMSANATPPSNGYGVGFELFGQTADQKEQLSANIVSSEYFAALKIPLRQGRLWDKQEIARGAKLAVINESLARKFWPNGDALGKQLRFPDLKGQPPFLLTVPDSTGWMQIIGVVGDAKNDGLRKPVKMAAFVPYTLAMQMYTQLLVRTRPGTSPLAILNRVRSEVKQVDPDQQIAGNTRDLEQWIEREREYAYSRLIAGLFGGFSLLALALAAFGLFSVVSYGVAQRTNEFGIRMALGASPGNVLGLILGSTFRNVLAGLAAGVMLSVFTAGLISKWAEGSEHTPLTIAAVAVLLLTTAGLATLIPARRAYSVDPMNALRYE